MKTLIYGIGNIARGDDGLGIRIVEKFRDELQPGGCKKEGDEIDFEIDYQLNLEDALLVSQYERVIFVDATDTLQAPLAYHPITPGAEKITFTSHEFSPETVLYLARELYAQSPPAFILLAQGTDFSLTDNLSDVGENSLKQALGFLHDLVQKEQIEF
jgi:hydrogenase maturation protease